MVTATSVADPTKSDSTTVTLKPPVTVSISPANVPLFPSESRQFTVTVTGAQNSAVTWQIVPPLGSISADGLYTAPACVLGVEIVTVTATSVEDSTKPASAWVTLSPVPSEDSSLGPGSTPQAVGSTVSSPLSLRTFGGNPPAALLSYRRSKLQYSCQQA